MFSQSVLDLGPRPWIVGHRGAAGAALENSIAAIRAGVEEGSAMIEIDVQLSADAVPIAFHDWDLRRLAGKGDIVERAPVERLREVVLATPDQPTRIATLDEILAEVPPSMPLNLELKRRFHGAGEFIPAIESVVATARPFLVSSFDWRLLSRLRSTFPELPLAPIGRFKAEPLLELADEIGAASIHVHHELAPALLSGDHRGVRPVLAYTVNDPIEALRLVDLGVAGVFTDYPARLREALGRDV